MTQSGNKKTKILITMGDVAGVGPEIIVNPGFFLNKIQLPLQSG